MGKNTLIILPGKKQIRKLNPAKLARITEGSISGIREKGYDVPIRRVKLHNRKAEWTLAQKVRRELGVVVGDVIVWCWIDVNGMLAIAEVGALDERDVDGRLIMGEVVARSKVREDSGSTVITIPKGAQIVLGNVIQRFLDPGLTDYPGIVTAKVFETKVSACRLTSASTKVLRRWPVPVLDAAEAWRIGFEPFMEALEFARIPPRYPESGLLNMPRVYAVNQVMIETAEMQAELRRSARGIMPARRLPAKQ